MAEENTFLTTTQAAEMMGCHINTIRNQIRSGKLRAAKFGRGWRIRKSDLLASLKTPQRGGHAPGYLRDAFLEWLEGERGDVVDVDEKPQTLRWLIGQLWHCTDVLPGWACDELDIPLGSTYAKAVQAVAGDLREKAQAEPEEGKL